MNRKYCEKAGHRLLNLTIIGLFLLLLNGCQTPEKPETSHPDTPLNKQLAGEYRYFICQNASQWQGQVVGDGHCVSLIKKCTGAPFTNRWRPGQRVQDASLAPGTIIATFLNRRYPSTSGYHAAIYSHQDKEGIWVWDQWHGKPVGQRLIKWHNPNSKPANTGSAYRVVLAD